MNRLLLNKSLFITVKQIFTKKELLNIGITKIEDVEVNKYDKEKVLSYMKILIFDNDIEIKTLMQIFIKTSKSLHFVANFLEVIQLFYKSLFHIIYTHTSTITKRPHFMLIFREKYGKLI